MISDPADRGLCNTCRNVTGCAFPRRPQKPVFYCEEFEIEPFVPTKTSAKDRHPAAALPVPEDSDSGIYAGLCSDCQDRETCTFPRVEGGVWHCEEYR